MSKRKLLQTSFKVSNRTSGAISVSKRASRVNPGPSGITTAPIESLRVARISFADVDHLSLSNSTRSGSSCESREIDANHQHKRQTVTFSMNLLKRPSFLSHASPSLIFLCRAHLSSWSLRTSGSAWLFFKGVDLAEPGVGVRNGFWVVMDRGVWMPSVFLDNGVAGVFPEDATKGDLKRPKVLEILKYRSVSDESLRFFGRYLERRFRRAQQLINTYQGGALCQWCLEVSDVWNALVVRRTHHRHRRQAPKDCHAVIEFLPLQFPNRFPMQNSSLLQKISSLVSWAFTNWSASSVPPSWPLG